MTSHDEIKGEGFEILDHHEPEKHGGEEPPEGAPGGPEQPVTVDVYAILRISIAQLASVAWQMMGLQPDPFTNELRKDIVQAKIAIDAAAALVDQLKPHIEGLESRDFQTLLTDLRLNFVTHSGQAAPSDEQSPAA